MVQVMDKKIIVILLVISITLPLFSGCLEKKGRENHIPNVEITYPLDGDTVSKIVTISGKASDPDDDKTLKRIEVKSGAPTILGMLVEEVPILRIMSSNRMDLFTNIIPIAKIITPEINCITAIIRFILWITFDLFFPKSMI